MADGVFKMGNEEDPVSPVRRTEGTSRNKYRLDGVSFTLKVLTDGFNDILLPSFVYTVILSEQRALPPPT
jgi:hypothetical protein